MSETELAPARGAPIIDADLICVSCSYNLRGLRPEGNCPECGLPIRNTLNSGIDRADRAWLRAQFVTMFLLAALPLIFPQGAQVRWAWIGGLLGVASVVALAIGAWRLTRPDPSLYPLGETDAFARGLRVASIGCAAVSTIGFLEGRFRDERLLFARGPESWDQLKAIAGLACLVLTLWLIPLLLLRLARRAGDPLLIVLLRVLVWALPLQVVASFLIFLVPPTWTRSERFVDGMWTFYSIVQWIARVVSIVYLLALGFLQHAIRMAANSPSAPPIPLMLQAPPPADAGPASTEPST